VICLPTPERVAPILLHCSSKALMSSQHPLGQGVVQHLTPIPILTVLASLLIVSCSSITLSKQLLTNLDYTYDDSFAANRTRKANLSRKAREARKASLSREVREAREARAA